MPSTVSIKDKKMTKRKKILIKILSLSMAICLSASFLYDGSSTKNTVSGAQSGTSITRLSDVYNDLSGFFNEENVYALPDTVADDQDISIIVEMSTSNTVDAYNAYSGASSVGEYLKTAEAANYVASAERERTSLLRMLSASGIKYTAGETFDNVLSGFEITLKAADFYKAEELLAERNATAIVGDVYESLESQVVTNYPNIDEDTGIFKNPLEDMELGGSKVDGTGVVVAILDTGLDYTHTAFDPAKFTSEKQVLTKDEVAKKIKDGLSAASTTNGLTAEDVYMNAKIPYAYDYADKDTDVLPINSEHGTHVAGIIGGNDDTIVGVAPNAQLAIMKVFSDASDGAKTSWLLAALDDCVNLGVDVINMSLGSGCGFSREVDKENVRKAYERVKDAGISLIASAANSYNATQGSEKNGNNPLTSNPDSGTVGSPSTYDAALSVASVDGVKTSYLKYNDEIIYFTEASTSNAEIKKDFVTDVLAAVGGVDSYDFEYVTIPGYGEAANYPNEDLTGKIVLVKRGNTTFEEKVRIALKDKGAAGIIIYNNVSGNISMSVGENIGAVCSLSQDEGELLAKNSRGIIRVSQSQKAGPFMSDFSSWGPTSDLKIKPEITAHGGEILSAVPGQGYERLSGTSMAAPNQAGATALVRQYVKYSGYFGTYNGTSESGGLTDQEVTKIVNCLMMSTADILYNKNGLAYAVRKQGAGLMSIEKSATTASYIVTYDGGEEMDKSKLELGDDKNKTGVYKMTFGIRNFSDKTVSYAIGSIALTEGVSSTYTGHGDTTVTMNGYGLEGTTVVNNVSNGSQNGNVVTVGAGTTAVVTVTLTLTDADKKYLNESFENGMYVEGFITLTAKSGTEVDVNVPFLAFYGDWTQAPIFDEEYYDTNKDELDGALDDDDKLMADAYATRVIGGLYSDYIATMGSYYFKQSPTDTKISADKNKIALSNQKATDNTSNYTISSIRSISAGLLRNAKEIYITATEAATGKVIFEKKINNQQKSYSNGGSTIYASSIDVEFDALELDLKNNTQYNFRVEAYIDYGNNADQNNARNVFEFPVFVDFEAPVVSDVQFRTEYDKDSKKNKLYADLYIYDNHYAMGVQLGLIKKAKDGSAYWFQMESFGNYITPVYSSFNSTNKVTIELTDYVDRIKNSQGLKYDASASGTAAIIDNNSFIASCYDYAMNGAMYEIRIPDEILGVYFNSQELYLSPNQTQSLADFVSVYPNESWAEVLDYDVYICNYNAESGTFEKVEDTAYVDIVNGKIVAKQSTPWEEDSDGKVKTENRSYVEIVARGKDTSGAERSASVKVFVYNKADDGYKKITASTGGKLKITGYDTEFAFYSLDSDDREIGFTGGSSEFNGSDKTLSMYPSEQVVLKYEIEKYFEDLVKVVFDGGTVGAKRVFEIDPETGLITALTEGKALATATVYTRDSSESEWKPTFQSDQVIVTVKDAFKAQAIYLMNYKGAGETINGEENVVAVPDDKGITTIYDYAFSNYEYVDKDTDNGDVIDDEDPYYIKQQYIGNNVIKKVILPYGVTTINKYAFAYLTALEEIVVPSTLTRIGVGAFLGCNNLKKITFAELSADGTYVECENNIQFINKDAFRMIPAGTTYENDSFRLAISDGSDDEQTKYTFTTPALTEFDFASVVAIGNYAFAFSSLNDVYLEKYCQSIGVGAFYSCTGINTFEYESDKLKIGSQAFLGCTSLSEIRVNAEVIPAYAFTYATGLEKVTIGKDVKVINEAAFAACSSLATFEVEAGNTAFNASVDGKCLLSGTELILVAPATNGVLELDDTVTSIAKGAFSAVLATDSVTESTISSSRITKVVAPGVSYVGDYAFANSKIGAFELGTLTYIGAYAFSNTMIAAMPDLSDTLESIGSYAFYNAELTSVDLSAYDGLTIGDGAFAGCLKLETVKLGNNAIIGDYAFYSTAALAGYLKEYEYDFNGKTYYEFDYKASDQTNSALKNITIGTAAKIGSFAFANNRLLESVTLGDGAQIGSYAFYNDASLATIDLSKVTAIGDFAFSGETLYVLDKVVDGDNPSYTYTIRYTLVNGEERALEYLFTSLAPSFTSVDLGSAEEIGKGAFAYNQNLESVTLPATLKANLLADYIDEDQTVTNNALSAYAFAGCLKLTSIDLPESLEIIDDYAFKGSGIETIDLKNVKTIGNYAFAITPVTKATFGDARVEDGAFYNCFFLSDAALGTLNYVGNDAFFATALKKADLSGATYVGSFAFGESSVESVIFGNVLEELGDNPFYGCAIKAYGKYETLDKFGIEVLNENCEISEKVFVADGVLYQKVPNGGLELVSYPMLKSDLSYETVADTRRIAARAFYGASLVNVTLNYELDSIGDKAFYDCSELSTVVFTGLDAPLLEEQYDAYYYLSGNIPFTGNYGETEGLGITKYYTWNITSRLNNYFYGANFVDYVGKTGKGLTMVRPANGSGYDTFIFDTYFGTIVLGGNAATSATLKVIDMINALPSRVSLADEAAVVAARNAYDALKLTSQQSLVSNYSALTNAESTIEYLKLNQSNGQPSDSSDSGNETGSSLWLWICIPCATVLCAAVVVYFTVFRRKKNNSTATELSDDEENNN